MFCEVNASVSDTREFLYREVDMPNETKNASKRPRIAVVTGGSRGLGKSTVLALADREVNSIFTFVSKSEEADEVVAAVIKAGAKAVAFA